MLALRDKSLLSLKSLADCSSGSIDILASSVPAQYILPELLGAFHKRYPNLTFHIKQSDTAQVVAGIAAHRGEIGFVGAKIENPKCTYTDFLSEKLILIAPKDRRFENASIDEAVHLLRKEPFIIREVGSGTRLEYETCLKHLGLKMRDLKIVACFSNTQSIVHAVSSGLGLAIVSERAARQYIQHQMIIPIPMDTVLERQFYMVQKKNGLTSNATETLIKFAHAWNPHEIGAHAE